jgi:hypothetical protein
MKSGVLAAAALIGLAAFVPASHAQGDGAAMMMEMGRTAQTENQGGQANRVTVNTTAPTLHGDRPAAGMLPPPTGPVRGFMGSASTAPLDGGDIRPAARQ